MGMKNGGTETNGDLWCTGRFFPGHWQLGFRCSHSEQLLQATLEMGCFAEAEEETAPLVVSLVAFSGSLVIQVVAEKGNFSLGWRSSPWWPPYRFRHRRVSWVAGRGSVIVQSPFCFGWHHSNLQRYSCLRTERRHRCYPERCKKGLQCCHWE